MLLELNRLSSQYTVKKLTEEDIPNILLVCKGNPTYYKYYKSEPTNENIKASLTALPPNKTIKDKYFVGFYNEDSLVAILDLITGYPNEDVAYIGWFMMNKEFQGSGVGTAIIIDIIIYLKEKNFAYVKLGYIKGNSQAQNFWIKNNFNPVGDEVKTDKYTIVCMQREM